MNSASSDSPKKPAKRHTAHEFVAGDAPYPSRLVAEESDFIEQEVARRTQAALKEANKEALAVQDVIIRAITLLAETGDSATGNHVPRIQHYVRALAINLQKTPRFAAVLTDLQIELLYKFAPLHDIGKVGIPDRILLKPGKLTDDEFNVMKNHTLLGRDAIDQAEMVLGQTLPILQVAKDMVLSHQEKWDGTGYPHGLAGEAIPLAARLLSVADVYDALISERIYKRAVPHDEAVAIIFQGRGSQFDPDMVDAFVEIQYEIQYIAERFADTESAMQKKIEYMANAIAENP
jgi:putative two-component system response regulator